MPTITDEMKYKVIGRVTQDGHVIQAYRIMPLTCTDKSKYQDIPTDEFKRLAKEGYIHKVKLAGETLTGYDGFELKKLPNVSYKPKFRAAADLMIADKTVGYVLINESDRLIHFNDKQYMPQDAFAVSMYDIQKFKDNLVGWKLETKVINGTIVNKLSPTEKLSYEHNIISIAVFDPEEDVYYVRKPYLHSGSLYNYINAIQNEVGKTIVYSYRAARGSDESARIWEELTLFNSSMRLVNNTIRQARLDNGVKGEYLGLDNYDEDEEDRREARRESFRGAFKKFTDFFGV